MQKTKRVETDKDLKDWNAQLSKELSLFKARRELETGGLLSLLVPDPEHEVQITSECFVPCVDWVAAGPAEGFNVI